MEVDCIPYIETGKFSKIVTDYLSNAEAIRPFYHREPALASFGAQIEEKAFSKDARLLLNEVLLDQYKESSIKYGPDSSLSLNLDLLKKDQTYTITTGHQLCLFTGPTYFIYKIASVIKLARKLKAKHPNCDFVPVYWLASEDHDFEEINHCHVGGTRLQWKTQQSGAVGRMNLDGMDAVYEELEKALPEYGANKSQILDLFKKAYLQSNNLAEATRKLVHALFGHLGLVIIDGDEPRLKASFSEIVKEELKEGVSSQWVKKQNESLQKEYKIQVNPREINLFYLKANQRNRIVRTKDGFEIDGRNLRFSEQEMFKELDEFPERFSPNVILRPVFQELILPNLAYVGGGGELAYWFQLKTCFEHFNIPMPVLLLRNSVLWMNQKQSKSLSKLNINSSDIFKPEGVLVKSWVKSNSNFDLELESEQLSLKEFYLRLRERAKVQDASLIDHVNALEAKQQKQLDRFREKLIRQKRKAEHQSVEQIKALKKALFPDGSLQERKSNFSDLWLEMGEELIPFLIDQFDMPSQNFNLIHST